jgi:hypothetical protein
LRIYFFMRWARQGSKRAMAVLLTYSEPGTGRVAKWPHYYLCEGLSSGMKFTESPADLLVSASTRTECTTQSR